MYGVPMRKRSPARVCVCKCSIVCVQYNMRCKNDIPHARCVVLLSNSLDKPSARVPHLNKINNN